MLFSRYLAEILLFFVTLLPLSHSKRRIVNGFEIKADAQKKYMVYITEAPQVNKVYDAWICGGALVTKSFIITSAACIEDVKYMYAIAGYNKYVVSGEIDKDPCTSKMKRKIVLVCVPKAYDFSYHEVEKWANNDIALVKTDRPYDLEKKESDNCDWIPKPIEINYDPAYQEPGIDALVLGWGHNKKFRKPKENNDLNQPTLHYSPLKIEDKANCLEAYKEVDGMDAIIKKYMICAMKAGNLDAGGYEIVKAKPNADGCQPPYVRVGGACQEPNRYREYLAQRSGWNDTQKELFLKESKQLYELFLERLKRYKDILMYETYKQQVKTIEVDPQEGYTFDDAISISLRRNFSDKVKRVKSRKTGICQNDHGGPLVTWVGAFEVLIGVASVFLLNTDYECTGPFLFTSTFCNGKFLSCVINAGQASGEATTETDDKQTEKTTTETEKTTTETEATTTVTETTTTVTEETTTADNFKYFKQGKLSTEILDEFMETSTAISDEPSETSIDSDAYIDAPTDTTPDTNTYFDVPARSEEKKTQYEYFRRDPDCDLPPALRGFEIIETKISWTDYHHGTTG